MEKVLHRSHARGTGEHGWLSTRYSFSFADWYDPKRMGFGKLRVINDDRIAPASGFGAHSHKDMEIVTIVMKGTLSHKDSMGNAGTIPAGDVQAMSAGSGVTHSEYNDEQDEPLELFQIWIEPDRKGVEPRYAQKSIGFSDAPGLTQLIVPDGAGAEGLPVYQNAYIHRAVLDAEHPLAYALHGKGQGLYVFVVEGEVVAGGETLGARDALGVWDIDTVGLTAAAPASALLIEVPMS